MELTALWKKLGCLLPLSMWRRWHSTMHFAIATRTLTTARCSWISGGAQPMFSLSGVEEFSRAVFPLAAVRLREQLPRYLANPSRRQKLARSETALEVWESLTRIPQYMIWPESRRWR